MITIRGQQATDWQDVYEMRAASPGTLPYLRPEWVRDELAQPSDHAWPIVAVVQTPERPRVVARMDMHLGWGRRAHVAYLKLEQDPAYAELPSQELLQETIRVAEDWWNKRRLQVTVPATDPATVALFESFDFVPEARLRQSVRIAGQLVDEVLLARVTGDATQPQPPVAPPEVLPHGRGMSRPEVHIRGGSIDDWEANHAIWSQPSVIWGTMQIPHPSADWNRRRVQERQPPNFWPLVAEADDKIVGNLGLSREEHNRSHVGHIGMMVHHEYQSLGIGSAILEAALELVDNWLGLSRVQLEVYPDNARAIALYEKHGFEKEGLHRAFGFRAGCYVDTFVMGRLRNQ
jgi:putative acetyltransferase